VLEIIVLLGFICIMGIVGFVFYRRSFQTPAPIIHIRPKDPFAAESEGVSFWDLKAPDMVQFEGKDYFVRRTIENRAGSYRWLEHLLDTGVGERLWLSVEDDEGLDLGVWKSLDMVDIQHGKPGDSSIVTSGKAYKRKESGAATWSSIKSDDTECGHMEFLEYEAADGQMLAFQRYDNAEWQASLGFRYRSSEFEIYPSTTGGTTNVG